MQVGGQLCELRASALLLTLLLFATDLAIVFIEVSAHLVILGLHVLEVLLARVEVMLPPPRVVATVELLNNGRHLSVVGHLPGPIYSLLGV